MNYSKILSKKVQDIKPSGIRKFFDLLETRKGVVSLTVGEPDFQTPWHIRAAGIGSLEKGHTHYTSNSGTPLLREAISDYLSRRFSLTYDPKSEVIVTVGGSEAIDLAMRSLIEPGDEVKGAALATMLSNVAVLIYFLIIYYVIRNRSVLSISPKKMIPEGRYIKSVFSVGFPSALGSFLASLSGIVMNNLASGYEAELGDVPVAAIGIAKKIDMLPMNVGMGLCQGMMPLVAYNYASGDYKRMRAFTNCARAAGIGFALVCIVAFESFATPLVSIFNGDETTVKYSADFLRIMCLAVPFMITNFQMSFTFQAMGLGKQSLFLSSLRQGLVNIPLLFVMNSIFGLYGIVWTQLVSDCLTTGISFFVYHRTYKSLEMKSNIKSEQNA